jgi:PiT family inorganic phosphate transporter
MTTLLICVIVVALLFDFVNGWNDSANAIATVVSTRVLSPMQAVVFAAILNFVGALVSERVAKTISGGLIDASVASSQVVLAAMLAATAWVAICTLWGLPISGSHSLIGGLVGAAMASSSQGWDAVQKDGIYKVILAMFASPIMGFLVGYVFLVATYWAAFKMTRNTARRTFGTLQIVSSGFMAFTHGMNDAQKVMGVITLALFSSGYIATHDVPIWVKILCAVVMGMGTAAGGWKVIKTLGMKLAHIRPAEGFAAETAAGLVLTIAANLGVPVSTTHTITGSILGVGSAYQAKSVKWSIGKKIVYAWVFTLPVTAVLAYLLTLASRQAGF